MEQYDKIIIGAGLYGMYSALFCGRKRQKVLVLECDPTPFRRATYINQARVHHGYHYPRSISTAMKSAGYFERFNKDYDFCINKEFDQIYATSSQYSWSNGEQFKNFCRAAGIPCEELYPEKFFKDQMCDGVFLQACSNIRKINPEKLVLISTIDVFKKPKDVDETSEIDTENLQAYGYNRYQLELWVRNHYPNALIIRLPGLFGKNIKKKLCLRLYQSYPIYVERMEDERVIIKRCGNKKVL